MAKSIYIAEKPSVAQEFAKALKENFKRQDGYLEADNSIVTWCVGHLVTMSYPEIYDPALKRWTLDSLPFLPKEFRYEIIPSVSKQFTIVKGLLSREDVERIYVCTDSGREGEYIYRLVDQMACVPASKDKKRVWIDSQTEEEILRGIQNAKPLSDYNPLSDAAYLRAQEDYLMGINFSRVLSLKYGNTVNSFLGTKKYAAISVGRVMTCVLGIVVRREREIRIFVKTPFYRLLLTTETGGQAFDAEFRAVEGSQYYLSPLLYKENGFREKSDAKKVVEMLLGYNPSYTETLENGKSIEKAAIQKKEEAGQPPLAEIVSIEKKKENKNPPLLFNLAELQNECSKLFKISPDQTLNIAQELYEKKLVTYPRTDARVLSTAVSKEIDKNIGGLKSLPLFTGFVSEIFKTGSYKIIAKTRYVNDKQITDHYAIIPTGQISALQTLPPLSKKVFELIVRRFLSIFFPPAVYQKVSITLKVKTEYFFAVFKVLTEEGYLKVSEKNQSGESAPPEKSAIGKENPTSEAPLEGDALEGSFGMKLMEAVKKLKKGMLLPINAFAIREGETAPPKRYNSGSMILAMENAGQFIEDEDLRAHIKGSGVGTSATRAEILNKLVKIEYLTLNKKTQIITPTLMGEMIFDVVSASIKSLLNAELTASWEKGLTYVADGTIKKEEYLLKLEKFVTSMTIGVKNLKNQTQLQSCFTEIQKNYKKGE